MFGGGGLMGLWKIFLLVFFGFGVCGCVFVVVLWLLGCFMMRIEGDRDGEEERKKVREEERERERERDKMNK